MTEKKSKDDKKGYRAADESGVSVPSRQLVLQYLIEVNQPQTFDQLLEQFQLSTRPEKRAISSRLSRMQKSGVIFLDRMDRYALSEKLNIKTGQVSGHPGEFGFVVCDDDEEDIYLNSSQMRRVIHGDTVLVKVIQNDRKGKTSGIILEVLSDLDREVLGKFYTESGVAFVEPKDTRITQTISVSNSHKEQPKSGDMVVVRLSQHPIVSRTVIGSITEVLGKPDTPEMEIEFAVRNHDLPDVWPNSVIDQIAQIESQGDPFAQIDNRRDLRDLPLYTIDGEDARDFDDAIYCEKLKSGWRLIVAIADVSHFVSADSYLDHEALNRGTSVYFPNRVIPMLPELLSNNLCSLMPDVDRFSMVCDMRFNSKGIREDYEFYSAIIRSHARLTYNIVEEMIEGENSTLRNDWKEIYQHIDVLNEFTDIQIQHRLSRGSIEFDFPEAVIQFSSDQHIESISTRERKKSHRIVEECMLAANICAGEFIENSPLTGIYRNHEGPKSDDLTDLRKFLGGFGLSLGGHDQPTSVDYAQLLDSVLDKPEYLGLVQTMLLRSLSQAEYSTESLGHFALNYPIYTHFTSPIRRYPDLIVHRLIKQILSRQPASPIGPAGQSLQEMAGHCSMTERRAEEASRDVMAWLKAVYMSTKIGQCFWGTVTGVREFGLFIQLDSVLVDGMVHVTGLGSDYYHFDSQHLQLIGERSNKRYRLGDRLEVNVDRVDLDDIKIDFSLTEELSKNKSDKKKASKTKRRKNKTTKRKKSDKRQ